MKPSPDGVIPSSRQGSRHNSTEMYMQPCQNDWIYRIVTTLPRILTDLSILEFSDLPTLHPHFIRLISSFKTIQILRLVSLTFQSFSEIIQLINRLPQTKSLYMELCRWTKPARFYPSKRLRLEKMFLRTFPGHGGVNDVLDWARSSQCLSDLKAFDFGYLLSTHMAAIHAILLQCAHTLRFLSLVLSSDLSDPFGETQLNPSPSHNSDGT